ncbi:MAG: flagellar motor switch protein FliM [Ignavibacteria bacterium]|jgi:flagellar motor switch protein FliM|nr:flagellar motor switch protein FliM [Ignavibacteria bacterium]
MAQTLPQNVIDNLLKDAKSGKDTSKYARKEVSNYDFRRPNRISKNQIRTLQTIHENFAEVFGYYLVSKLQTTVNITPTSVDQLFYSEFILSVSNPSCLYVFEIAGTDGNGILEISPQLALTIVERLLGGNADALPKSRTITPIEQTVVRGMIEHALSDLRTAWKSISDINFKYQRLEQEADFVQIAPSSEIVIVISFDVHIGSHTFLLNLCFPTFALEEVLAKLNRQLVTTTGHQQSAKKLRENILAVNQQISTTYLPIVAELGKTSITVTELLELKEGDIIKTKKRIDQEIEVIIAGKRKLAARPGVVEGKKAVRIIRPLTADDLYEEDLSYKEEKEV